MSEHKKAWHQAAKGEVHAKVLEHVQRIEQDQFDLYDRFVKLAALYDPNGAVTASGGRPEMAGVVSENVIATNVDTVTAIVAAADLRARMQTTDADWAEQRRARELEFYAEGLEKVHNTQDVAVMAFGQGSAVRGTGIVYVDEDGEKLCVEHVLADDIVVNERECRTSGGPRQMHRRRLVDRDDLIARFPKFEDEICRAQQSGGGMWAGYRPLEENEIVLVQSWRLPYEGTKGRYTETIDGFDLVDREWSEDHFPFAVIRWSKRPGGWYGIGLAERIKGHQQVLNNGNFQIDRLVNLNAIPTTYVRMQDAKLATTVQRPGAITVYKGDLPVTPTPPAISPEVYKRQADVKASAYEESGVSRMAASASKPAGLDSGAALREYRDATTQRFALQEKAYEQLRRDIVILMLAACKRLGKKAPVVLKRSRFGARKIAWSKVDMGDVKVQIAMASGLARTPAGRTQLVLELAQGGIISQDSAKRLLQHPDVERELSLYTAALENIERCFDEIADGQIVMPEPFMHLKLAVWRGQQTYLKWRDDGAPEEILEAMRQFVVQAAHMAEPAPAANDNMDPAAMPMPGAVNENVPADPMMAAMPTGPAPVAALAPEAMNLRAV